MNNWMVSKVKGIHTHEKPLRKHELTQKQKDGKLKVLKGIYWSWLQPNCIYRLNFI